MFVFTKLSSSLTYFLAALTEAIIAQHASLRGIARQLAEVYYIVGAQQLDGYGQECFLARDERGTEVLIGASLTGIVIREGPSPHFYKWNDITNLVNHKRYFGIECQNYEHSVQFILDEPDSAKYVWKMCKSNISSIKVERGETTSYDLAAFGLFDAVRLLTRRRRMGENNTV